MVLVERRLRRQEVEVVEGRATGGRAEERQEEEVERRQGLEVERLQVERRQGLEVERL